MRELSAAVEIGRDAKEIRDALVIQLLRFVCCVRGGSYREQKRKTAADCRRPRLVLSNLFMKRFLLS
jgi:hypothetical protein